MNIELTVEKYILTELHLGKRTKIGLDESLVGSGILDSLTLLQLIAFLEEQYQVKFEDQDINPEYFRSINAIKTFIEQKLRKS